MKLPCGRCDIGTYSVTPLLNGVDLFRGAETRKEAIGLAPRCKCEPGMVCIGAVDWIAGADFPLTDEACDAIVAWCRQ